MRLDTELRDLARQIARKESRRPKQASLRRAVSTGYYALFHLLVREASCLLAPAQPPHLRPLLARAFQHSDMLGVSKSFAAGALPKQHPQMVVDSDLKKVASAFIALQQARHEADYDVGAIFTRTQTEALLAQVDEAFAAWLRVRKSDGARVYLTSLLAERSWRR